MRKDSRPWALFDADDTIMGLMLNGEIVGATVAFEQVAMFACQVIAEEEGFDMQVIRAKMREIDHARCTKHGFSRKNRFPGSMRMTYKELCMLEDRAYDPDVARHLEEIGYSVFDLEAVPLPSAANVVRRVESEYRIAIVTKGNGAHQRSKVRDAGFSPPRRPVIPMAHKSVAEWQVRVLDRLRIDTELASRSFVIGDSMKSDVNPALELGLNAIHVDVGVFLFEKGAYASPREGRTLHTVSHIERVLDHIPLRK